jgi:hypothetical protein
MKHFAHLIAYLFLASLSLTCVPAVWSVPNESVLYTFTGKDGANPGGSLAMDATGHLFGSTTQGGNYNAGTVFELTPENGGRWKESVIHVFSGGYDGGGPYAGLILDEAGNLYGATPYGGGGGCDGGCGVVFKLAPSSHGKWKESVLHVFDGIRGAHPYGTLLFDSSGNLYGTTQFGGHFGAGAVFMLTQVSGHSHWRETLVHSFNGVSDGDGPYAGLIFDAEGNLYGTTTSGSEGPTVFKLTPSKSGVWTETVLHRFGDRLAGPIYGGVVFDSNGNLYGSTFGVEGESYGQVFELSPSNGSWVKSTIYTFCANTCSGGAFPYASMIIDKKDNLFGTTAGGNAVPGAVFEMTPSTSGWEESELHSFAGGTDGSGPLASLISDSAGNLYGTTVAGGNNLCQYSEGCGIVFRVTP